MMVNDKNIALRKVNSEKKSQKIINNSENNTVYDITLEKDDFSLCIDAKDYSRFVKVAKQINLDESRDIVSYLLYCQKVTKSLNQLFEKYQNTTDEKHNDIRNIIELVLRQTHDNVDDIKKEDMPYNPLPKTKKESRFNNLARRFQIRRR